MGNDPEKQAARMDRRVARTRASLQRALIALAADMPFDQLTVDAICTAADVGRSTFYAHYPSKEALRRDAIDAQLRALRSPSGTAGDQSVSAIRAVLVHVKSHLRLSQMALCGGGDRLALEALERAVADHLRRELTDHEPRFDDRTSRELMLKYMVGGFMAMLAWWIADGARVPADAMENRFRALSGALLDRPGSVGSSTRW